MEGNLPRLDIPTVDRDESLTVVREMFQLWQRAVPLDRRHRGEQVIFVIEDLERYFEKGLIMPFDSRVKKGIRTRLDELKRMRDEIERIN